MRTLTEFTDILEKWQKELKGKEREILTEGGKQLLIRKKGRIHNEGKTTDGQLIGNLGKALSKKFEAGPYSKAHGKKRNRRGRRTDKVDLQLEGRAGSLTTKGGGLIGNYIVGNSGKDVVIGFVDDQYREIAEHTENYRKAEIFTSSDEEVKAATDVITKLYLGVFED